MLGKSELIARHEVVSGDEWLIHQSAVLDIEEDILACGNNGSERGLQTHCLTGFDGRAGHRA